MLSNHSESFISTEKDNSDIEVQPAIRNNQLKRNLIKIIVLSEVGMIIGFNLVVFNPLGEVLLREVHGLDKHEIKAAKGDVNMLFSLGSLFGALVAGLISEKLGRKRFIVISDVFILCTIGLYWIENLYVLYLARFLVGFFSCSQQTVTNIMLTEILPRSISGIGNAVVYTFTASFIFVGFIQGSLFTDVQIVKYWRCILCWPIIPQILKLIALPFILKFESPRHYFAQHRRSTNLEINMAMIFADTYPTEDVKTITSETLRVLEEQEESKIGGGLCSALGYFVSSHTRKRMVTGCFLLIGQQMTGLTYYSLYSTDIFDRISHEGKKITFFIAGVKLLAGFVAIITMKSFGRKFNLIVSNHMQAVCSMLIVLSIQMKWPWISYIAGPAYMFFLATGYGSCINAYVTEILPASAASFCIAIGWIAQASIAKILPLIAEDLGDANMMLFFAVTCFIWVFILDYFLVETRDKLESRVIQQFKTRPYSLFNFE